MRDVAGIGRLQRHVSGLLGYLERNRGALVRYAARRRRGQPISTAFVESAVNEIVAKRMNKAQQGIVKLAGFGARSITWQHCAGVHAAIWAQVSCRHCQVGVLWPERSVWARMAR